MVKLATIALLAIGLTARTKHKAPAPHPAPTAVVAPTPSPQAITKADILATLDHEARIVADAQAHAAQSDVHAAASDAAAEKAIVSTAEADKRADALQGAIVTLGKDRDAEKARADSETKRADDLQARYWRIKYPLCILAAASVVLALLHFKLLIFIPPPWYFVALGAPAIAVFGVLVKIL